MKKYISISDFSKVSGYTTNHVYKMGEDGTIKIETVAGFKVIDSNKFNPSDFKKITPTI